MISVIIPAYKEEGFLERCLESIRVAIFHCPCAVEIYVSQNIRGIGKARNIGARNTQGEILIFIDADCTMSQNFLKEVYEKSTIWKNLGGGTKWIKFDKYSLGRILSLIPVAIWLYWHQVTFGAFWIRREAFETMHGFIENDDVHLDYDFALRLKRLAKLWGRKFRSLKRSFITWSTRGYDRYGEWFWLKQYKLYRD